MATNRESTITILYGSGATAAPTDLFDGEMAYANTSGKLFVGGSGNNSANWVGARILDEDDFASDSDQHLATQQSIKAYVTSAIAGSSSGVSSVNGATGAVVLEAANGLTQSKSGNTITYRGVTASTSQIGVASFNSSYFSVVDGAVSLVSSYQVTGDTVVQGTGISVTRNGNAVTINNALGATAVQSFNGQSGVVTYSPAIASTSVTGVASFSSDNFAVDGSGVVTVKNGGIANDELVNSSVTINTLPLSLGGSVTITSDYVPEGSTNQYFLASRARTSVSATGAGVGGGAISYNSGTGVFTLGITGSANQVSVANNGSGLITLSLPDDVVINNSLTVNGTVTVIDTQNLIVEDPLISLATGNASNSVDIGFFGTYNSTTYTGIFRDATDGKYYVFNSLTEQPTTTVNRAGTGYDTGTLVAKISAGTYS